MTETVLFPCRSCRAELRAPSSRVGSMVLCGACRERVLVPDSSAIARLRELATLGQQGSKGLLRFYFKYVLVDWPEPAPELRACEACGELSIQVLSRCSCNNGLRLSTSLRELSLASLEDCAKATEDLPRWKKRQNIIQLVVIGLIVLSILWLYFTRNILAVVIFGPIMAASLLICGLAVLVGVKLLLNWQLLPKLPSSTPRSKLEAIEALEAELLRPFLARLSIFYRMSLPASLDDEDSNLLLQLLQKKGQSLDRRELRRWLFVTVFRIDMERIADQLRFLKQEQGCPDTLAAWQIWSHACGAEALCVLRWFLLLEGEDLSEVELEARLKEHQDKATLEAFERDLTKRRSKAPELSINAVDAMNPFSFEDLLAILYRALGHKAEVTPRRGERGADVILDLAGERRAVQARLYANPVGPDAVREVSAALKPFKCQRGMVVTNSSFTKGAQELAESNGIELVDRAGLEALIKKFNNSPRDAASLSLLLRPKAAAPQESPSEIAEAR